MPRKGGRATYLKIGKASGSFIGHELVVPRFVMRTSCVHSVGREGVRSERASLRSSREIRSW